MVSIAVIEDNEEEKDQLLRLLRHYAQTNHCEFHITPFGCAETFLEDCRRSMFDIIFMDIDLPHMNGMEAARRLRRVDTIALLIFTTNLSQYAIQGYEVDAMDYVLKPINRAMLDLKMHRAVRLCQKHKVIDVCVKTQNGFVRLRSSDIQFIEIYNHHIRYHTEEATYSSYGTMKQVVAGLPESGFFRTTASYIVNLQYVSQMDGMNLYIKNHSIPISRLRKKAFVEAMNQFLSGVSAEGTRGKGSI